MKEIEWRVIVWGVAAIVFGAGPLVIRNVDWNAWGIVTLLIFPLLLLFGTIALWRLQINGPWWTPFTSLHSFFTLMVGWGLIVGAQLVGIMAFADLTGFTTKIFRVWYDNSPLLFLILGIAYLAQGYLMILWGSNIPGSTNRSKRFLVAVVSLPLHLGVVAVSNWMDFPWLSGDAIGLFASEYVLIPLLGLIVADGPWRSPADEGELAAA